MFFIFYFLKQYLRKHLKNTKLRTTRLLKCKEAETRPQKDTVRERETKILRGRPQK